MLLEKDNEIFKLYQEKKILKGFKVLSKLPKTFKTEFGDIAVKKEDMFIMIKQRVNT